MSLALGSSKYVRSGIYVSLALGSSKYVRSGIYVSLAVNMSDQAYMCH